MDDGRELVGGARELANAFDSGVPGGPGRVEFFLHMRERRAHDIAMMYVRPDGPVQIEPERVNEMKVFGIERGRVRAQVVDGASAAAVIDDEPHVERLRPV